MPSFAIGATFSGIHAIYPRSPEIIAVYPILSATIQPHSQEIRFHRGDSFDLDVTVQNDLDPPSVVSIPGSVLRFAVSQGFGEIPGGGLIADAILVRKSSYDAREIEVTDAVNGRAKIHIRRKDTYGLPRVPMTWGLEITTPYDVITASLLVSSFAGDSTVLVQGGDLVALGVEAGDIMLIDGIYVLVADVLSSMSLLSDSSSMPTLSSSPATLYRGQTRLVASGPWTVLGNPLL